MTNANINRWERYKTLKDKGWTSKEIGQFYGVSAQTVSMQIKEYERHEGLLKSSDVYRALYCASRSFANMTASNVIRAFNAVMRCGAGTPERFCEIPLRAFIKVRNIGAVSLALIGIAQEILRDEMALRELEENDGR